MSYSILLQKDKEDLEEVSTELELADEDELVPYVIWEFLDTLLCSLTAPVIIATRSAIPLSPCLCLKSKQCCRPRQSG